MNIERKRRFYELCDPFKSLTPTSELYVDLDHVDGKAVRGMSWSRRLRMRVELSGDTPVQIYFTGLPGSGKSTELRRVAAELQDGEAKLLSIIVNAEESIDFYAPIDIPDVMIALLWGTEKCLLALEGKSPEDALKDGVLTRIWAWLKEIDPQIVKLQGNLGVVGLGVEMKSRPGFRKQVRDTVALYLTSFLKHVREAFAGFNSRARSLGYQGLFVVLDSLEKLRGTASNWQEVVESAERVFSGGAPYLQLPVHVLYTVPPALVFRPLVPVDFLPMIKVADRDGKPFEQGYHAARSVIRKRIPDDALEELLGPTFEARIFEIIGWSGGYLREIVRILREILALEEPGELSEEAFHRMLRYAGEGYRRAVMGSGALEWLGRVAAEKSLRTENDAERLAASDMLQGSIVFRYLNDDDWYDLHPAVRDMPEIEAAMRRSAAGRPSS
jgi:hypothetical protein